MKKNFLSWVFWMAIALLPISLHATNYDETALNTTVYGGASEEYDVWDVGDPDGVTSRKFRVEWDMYGIPDQVSLIWNAPDENGKTYFTGYVSYDGNYEITLAPTARKVYVIFNQGNNPDSGTAWEYRLVPVESCEQVLATRPRLGAAPDWRNVLLDGNAGPLGAITGGPSWKQFNSWADVDLETALESGACENDNFKYRTYIVTVAAGCKALRVITPAKVNLAVKKDQAPVPGQVLQRNSGQGSSRNRTQQNMVFLDRPTPGTYYIVCALRKSDSLDRTWLNGNRDNGAGNNLLVDQISTGDWLAATVATAGVEFQTILVGVQPTFARNGGPGSTPGPGGGGGFTLLCHGRVNGPHNMWQPAMAAQTRWNRPSYHVNWSQGAHWNTGVGISGVSLNGARFIVSGSITIQNLMRRYGVAFGNIDLIGHSWGTYFGSELTRPTRKVNRFFALDPATAALDYDRPVTFKNSKYSMAIRAGTDKPPYLNQVDADLASNTGLTLNRAEDSVLVHSNAFIFLTNHELPKFVFRSLVLGKAPNCPAYTKAAFDFAVASPSGANTGNKSWTNTTGYEAHLWARSGNGSIIGMITPSPKTTHGTTKF